MGLKIDISNNTSSAIVVNGALIGSMGSYLVGVEESESLITQILHQGVIQLDALAGGMLRVTTAYYRNEYQPVGSAEIELTISEDFTFSIANTPIQKVPLQTNRTAQYPFLSLANQPLPAPWTIVNNGTAIKIENLNSSDLHFGNPSAGAIDETVKVETSLSVSKSVQIHFKLQVGRFPVAQADHDGFYLPGGFYLKVNEDNQLVYYWDNGENTRELGPSIIDMGSTWTDITIILFDTAYILIENGENVISVVDPVVIHDVQFRCVVQATTNSANNVDVTFSELEIGVPLSATDSIYAMSGVGDVWSEPYHYGIDGYQMTNWVACGDLIASILYHPTDNSEPQRLIAIDVKTGERVVLRDTGYMGSAYRSPFVDEDMGFICFPINEERYYVYDINVRKFVQLKNEGVLYPNMVKYSEEVCHMGVIYFIGYDNFWYAYNILSQEIKKTPCCELDSEILRAVKPVVQNGVIYAGLYTLYKNKHHYAEFIAYDIDGVNMEPKWHKEHENHIWSYYISCDHQNLYYWNVNCKLHALDLETGIENWCNDTLVDRVGQIGVHFAPITNQLGAIYIATDDGDILSLSPENGTSTGTIEKPFNGKTFRVGQPFNNDAVKIYPGDDHSPVNLWSQPRVVEGHVTFQGNGDRALYSVNVDTGVIQKMEMPSNCYLNNFRANAMTKCIDTSEINVVQMQQYDKNFYFDAALMAQEYVRDPKTATVRPKESCNSFYTVTVSVQDSQGVPKNALVYMKNMGEEVSVISSLFEKDEGEVCLGKGEQVTFKPGFDGKFKFEIPAERLYCPAMFFWSDFMLPDVSVAFFPNQSNVDVLRQQQSKDVLEAKDYSGKPVFAASYRNDADAQAIVNMIGNSVGGSVLAEEPQRAIVKREGIQVRSIAARAQEREQRSRELKRRAKIKQDVLTTEDYKPTLTMDYCAFADDTTDNCLCSNDPASPIIDQPYLNDSSTYVSGEFVLISDDLVGPVENIKYDPDLDKSKWRAINRAYQEQVEQYFTEQGEAERQVREIEIFGFKGFVKDCIVGKKEVRLYHWEPQDEGVQKGIKKVFRVVMEAGERLYRFVVKTVEQGLQVLQSFFDRVAETFEQLMQWLSWVLNWRDILTCQQNLQNCIVNNFKKGVEHFEVNQDAMIAKVDKGVDYAETKIESAFDMAETFIGGYNYNDVIKDYQNPRTLMGEGGDNVTNQMDYLNNEIGLPSSQAELRQYTIMYYKYEQSLKSKIPSVLVPEQFHKKLQRMARYQKAMQSDKEMEGLVEAIQNEIEAIGQKLGDIFDKLKGQISGETIEAIKTKMATIAFAFKTKSNTVKQFFETCMVTLLDLIESFAEFVLEAARLLITDVIKLIPEIINSLLRIMTKPINVKALNYVWKDVLGIESDLTIMGFTTLVISLPMTLTLKLAGQSDSFFFQDNDTLSNMSSSEAAKSDTSIRRGLAIGNAVACWLYADLDTTIDGLSAFMADSSPLPVIGLKFPIICIDLAIVGMTFPSYTDVAKVFGLDYYIWAITLIHNFFDTSFLFLEVANHPIVKAQAALESVYGAGINLWILISFIGKLLEATGEDYDDRYGSIEDIIFWLFHFHVYSVPEILKSLSYGPPASNALLVGMDFIFGRANALMFIYWAVKA